MNRIELLDYIEPQAKAMIQVQGYHAPMFMVVGADGNVEFGVIAATEPQKIGELSRATAEHYVKSGAKSLVFIAEVWSLGVGPGMDKPPSWSLCLQGADPGGLEIRTFPVTKDAEGQLHVGPRSRLPAYDSRSVLSNLPWRTR